MFEIVLKIARPVNVVFAQLARIEESPLWYSALKSVNRRHLGPIDVGTRFSFRRDLGGNDVINEIEVTALEPDRVLELKSISGPTPFVYRYELTPAADGTTLRLEGAISGMGLKGPIILLSPLAEGFFRRGMIDNLKSLRRLIETKSSNSPHTSANTIQTSRPSRI